MMFNSMNCRRQKDASNVFNKCSRVPVAPWVSEESEVGEWLALAELQLGRWCREIIPEPTC
jgi:hypothetical protein